MKKGFPKKVLAGLMSFALAFSSVSISVLADRQCLQQRMMCWIKSWAPKT